YQDRGTMPGNNATAGLPAANLISGKYVGTVTVGGNGVISIAYSGTDAHATLKAGGILVMTPVPSAGSVSWECTSATIADNHLPAACR
ncbi:MAG: pilin, partial [Woeseia sp.]